MTVKREILLANYDFKSLEYFVEDLLYRKSSERPFQNPGELSKVCDNR